MRLRSRQRLRRQSDFAAVRQEGRRQFGAAFVLAVRRRPPDPRFELPRFAVVASRRVGNAVVRNRQRRRLREIFRAHQQIFSGDTDIIATLQPKGAEATYCELEKQFLAAARRCGFGSGGNTQISAGSAPLAEGSVAPLGERRATPKQTDRATPGE